MDQQKYRRIDLVSRIDNSKRGLVLLEGQHLVIMELKKQNKYTYELEMEKILEEENTKIVNLKNQIVKLESDLAKIEKKMCNDKCVYVVRFYVKG